MDVYECIKKRRSIRKFLDIPVEWEKIALMIDAAKSAPSAGNLQAWKFVVVTNRETIKKLSEAALQQLWIQTAPCVIVVCMDMKKHSRYYGTRGEKKYIAEDCGMAIENILLMAEAQDLGATMVGAFEEEAVSRALEIPDDVMSFAIIPIGYPDEKPPMPAKFSLRDVAFFETYGNKIRHAGLWPLEKQLDKGRKALQVFTAKAIEKGKETVDKAKQKKKEADLVNKMKQEHKKSEEETKHKVIEEVPSPPKDKISKEVLEHLRRMSK
jgi:nitroreductase